MSTDYTSELDTFATTNENATAVAAGYAMAEPVALDPTERFHVITSLAGPHVIDLADHRDWVQTPAHKTGTARLHDAASFVAYVDKHQLPETETYADVTNLTVTTVINAHQATTDGHELTAGWGDHRATLTLQRTPAWKEWLANDRALLDQVAFAEHIEEHLGDIVDPPAADLLEIAQTFNAKRDVTFESSTRLSTGAVQVEYRESDTTSAGKKGRLQFPERITLGLRIFEGEEPRLVAARLRYRLTGGTLRLGYLIDKPGDAERATFDLVVDTIAAGIAGAVMYGTPANPLSH